MFFLVLFSLYENAVFAYSTQIEDKITPDAILEQVEKNIYVYPDLPTMIGQMIMVGFHGTTPKTVGQIANDIAHGNVGGVILFSRDFINTSIIRNIVDKKQTTELITYLQSKATIPLFIGVDQEGGQVQRFRNVYGVPNTLSAANLAKQGAEHTAKQMDELGGALHSMGVNLNFAPVVDLNINPTNPIIAKVERSYGATTQEVLPHAKAVIKALLKNNITFSLKHFPGHGSSKEDSHFGLPDITTSWKEAELEPYRALAQYQNKGMVLVGHLFNKQIDPYYPSSLSYTTITQLLRKKLHWNGVVITDDLQMSAISSYYTLQEVVVLAINAGVDILLFGNNIEYDPFIPERVQKIIIHAIRRGTIPLSSIKASYRRIMNLKKMLYPNLPIHNLGKSTT